MRVFVPQTSAIAVQAQPLLQSGHDCTYIFQQIKAVRVAKTGELQHNDSNNDMHNQSQNAVPYGRARQSGSLCRMQSYLGLIDGNNLVTCSHACVAKSNNRWSNRRMQLLGLR